MSRSKNSGNRMNHSVHQYALRAAMVCVDYADYLAITLPYNRHHFDEVLVVTTHEDSNTQRLARKHGCGIYCTDAFYRQGAVFNKWLALEEGLDRYGRYGWMCLMDADVLWPKEAKLPALEIGCLYSPLRHMLEGDAQTPIPPEHSWQNIHVHGNINEWAGYTQIFHDNDHHLPQDRFHWHETNWRHGGGADSFFQFRWPSECKKRLPWNVLHLGPHGTNWCGVNGTVQERRKRVESFIASRVRRPNGTIDYSAELLPAQSDPNAMAEFAE